MRVISLFISDLGYYSRVLDLQNSVDWQNLNTSINQGLPPHNPNGTILDQAVLQRLTNLENNLYARIYDDPSLRLRAMQVLTDLTTDFATHQPRIDNIRAYYRIFRPGGKVTTSLEITLAQIKATRFDRYTRFANITGLTVPHSFKAWRGQRSLEDVQDVATAWSDGTPLRNQQKALAAWSLTPTTAQRFATQNQTSGVIFQAEIPFALTFADKFLDGHRFINPFWEQNEIICGDVHSENRPILTQAESAKVFFQGRLFTYGQRDELFDALHAVGVSW